MHAAADVLLLAAVPGFLCRSTRCQLFLVGPTLRAEQAWIASLPGPSAFGVGKLGLSPRTLALQDPPQP